MRATASDLELGREGLDNPLRRLLRLLGGSDGASDIRAAPPEDELTPMKSSPTHYQRRPSPSRFLTPPSTEGDLDEIVCTVVNKINALCGDRRHVPPVPCKGAVRSALT